MSAPIESFQDGMAFLVTGGLVFAWVKSIQRPDGSLPPVTFENSAFFISAFAVLAVIAIFGKK